MHGLPAAIWQARFVWLAAYFGAIAVESVVLARRRQPLATPGLIVVNTSMWLVELFLRGATFGLRLAVFAAIARLAPHAWSSGWRTALVAYLAVDFIYYWKHRLLHRSALGWALHAPHHSSESLNLLAAIRLGWLQRLVDDLFFLPLALLGFPPLLLLFVILANEVYPAWCHLGVVGPLGFLDGILNTPENHRAHHAVDRTLADSNYASTFMLWDRWFGTWKAGRGVTRFGIREGAPVLNPVTIQLAPLGRWLRRSAGRRPPPASV